MNALADDQVLDADRAVRAAAALLGELRDGHRRLEERALRVEAELCSANAELAARVEELELLKRRLEAVLAAIPSGVLVYDEDGRIARVNPAASALLGSAEASLVGTRAPESLARSSREERLETLARGGDERIVSRRRSPVTLADGTRAGSVEVLDDRTELARASERMRRLTRAAAMGTMIGGVAHEVRNPLHAIGGFAQLLRRDVEPGSKAARHADRILAGVADLEAIVSSMLGAAGRGRLEVAPNAIEPLLAAAVEAAFEGRPREAWTVEVRCTADVAEVDAIELRQAVRNLVANALEAQPDGGRVEVHARIDDGGDLVIAVHDAGPGVPPSAREHLFDPFFTTRAAGTGLGLALVLRVAELHGGSIESSPAPSPLGGALFVLRLPARSSAPIAAP